MENNFVPECFFDTVLVKTILNAKRVNHQKGCSNVVKKISSGKLKDDFAVGIIDKDKRELNYLAEECKEVVNLENLVLLKHKTRQHYFIQLAPAIEVWILKVAKESDIDISTYALSNDLGELKKATKSKFAESDENLKRLCKKLVGSEGETIKILSSWLNYLFLENRNADINKLKGHV